jgi:branched-chain amino acid transport system substrate-binding protein
MWSLVTEVARNRRISCAAAVLVLVPAGGLAALTDGRAAPSRSVATVQIGALLDLKSGWTSLGRASRVTLQLAAADAGNRLVRAGSPVRVRLRIVDVRGNPEVAVRELRRLAASGVHVVIGPESSAEVRAVRAAARSLGVVVVSQGSTAHSLAISGDNVFRLVPDDRREAEALVALLKRDGVKAIVPAWRDDPGNAGLVTSVRSRFQAQGGIASAGVRYATDETAFASTVAQLRAQVSATKAGGKKTAVYLAGFDEVAELFHAATKDPVLKSVAWYGSDGVALSRLLIGDRTAASFAAARGYPNPILGLDAAAVKRSATLRRRVRARLGHDPDAFALTAYDALQIAARAAERAGGAGNTARFKRALARTANGYRGVTGTIRLNAAGDRAYGSFDFWSVCANGGSFAWRKTSAYLASAVGHGRIVKRQACATR